jgi:hypothetical protein
MMTPALHTESKIRLSDHARERALLAVARAAHGTRRLLPVILDGRIIAWAGSSSDGRVGILEHKPWMRKWIDKLGNLMGWPTIDAMILDITVNGKTLPPFLWFKRSSSSVVARWWHHWAMQGSPQAPGLYDGTANTFKGRDDTTPGAMYHGGNVSPGTKHILSGGFHNIAAQAASDCGVLMPYDFVGSYDSHATSASPQTMTNSSTAARYITGGDFGMDIMPVCTGNNGVTGLSALAYTSDTGTAPEGAAANVTNIQSCFISPGPTVADQWPGACEYPSSMPVLSIPLRAGDNGVKQIDSVTWGGAAATMSLVLGRPLAWMPVQFSGAYYPYDFVKQVPSVPRIVDGCCLTFAVFLNTAASGQEGHLQIAWSS